MKQIFRKGRIYLLSGPLRLCIEKGKILAIGKEVFPPEQISIPWGKRIPLEILEDTELDLELRENGSFSEISFSTIPQEWDNFVRKCIQTKPKTVVVFGEIDTGKTFLTTYLANRLVKDFYSSVLSLSKEKLKIAILDCDIGQSDIGPPGTIGLARVEKPVVFLSELTAEAIHFVGAYSPAYVQTEYFYGLKKLLKQGLEISEILIVNTPGWVYGQQGRMFTGKEIEILNPEIILLLEQGKELEYLAEEFTKEQITRLTVSTYAVPRTPNQRKNLRETITREYFRNAKEMVLSADEIVTGLFVPPMRQAGQTTLLNDKIKGLVAGLIDSEDNCLGLGIVQEIDSEKKIHLLTPLSDKEKIKSLQFGSVYLNPDGTEVEY